MRVHPRTTIADVMTATPHTVGSEQKLSVAHDLMRKYGIRHLPVLDAGELVGMLSQRDLYFLEAVSGVEKRVDSVSEAMAPDVYTVEQDTLLAEVARTMHDRKLGCAVVIERGKVVGIFTATDALGLVAEAVA